MDDFGKYGVIAFPCMVRDIENSTKVTVHVHASGGFSMQIENWSGLFSHFTTNLTADLARQMAKALNDGADLHDRVSGNAPFVAEDI